MRYTPSLPPLAEVPESAPLKGLHHTQPVRRVGERLLPTQIVEHFSQRGNRTEATPRRNAEEKRASAERRLYCRRTLPDALLLETRSGFERRRRNRRSGDAATAVDDEV